MKAFFPAPVENWHNDTYESINPSRPELSCAGKKVIVTGGGAGIGQGLTEAFAQAGAASVAITGRREGVLLETKKLVESKYSKTRISTHVADVTDVAGMEKAAKEIGQWDILVMNAGYYSAPGRVLDSDLDEWWKSFEINIKGAFITTRAFLPAANPEAVVIAISTGAVILSPKAAVSASAYVTSKLGLMRFIEVLAAEHPDIHFTTVHPGVIETAMQVKSEMELPGDTIELSTHYTVWLASPEARFLRDRFSWCNWDVEEMKGKAKAFESSEMFVTGINGWPHSPEQLQV